MSTIGFRIYRSIPRPDPELVRQAARFATPNLGDCMNRVRCLHPSLTTVNAPGVKMAGVAFTVKTRPADNLMVHKALDLAEPGDVLVIDAGGEAPHSILGEIMCRYARKRGLAGMVIDGPIRDRAGIREMGFPVWARGSTPGGPYKDGPGEINVPVTVGGVVVFPGDIVVGDEDGVVVIPRLEAAAVLAEAASVVEKERAAMRAIEEGRWDRRWVDEILDRKGCEVFD